MVDKLELCGVEKSHAKDLRRCQAKSVRLFMIHLGKHMAQESKVVVSFKRFGSCPPSGNSLAADAKVNRECFTDPLRLLVLLDDFLLHSFHHLFLSASLLLLPLELHRCSQQAALLKLPLPKSTPVSSLKSHPTP